MYPQPKHGSPLEKETQKVPLSGSVFVSADWSREGGGEGSGVSVYL